MGNAQKSKYGMMHDVSAAPHPRANVDEKKRKGGITGDQNQRIGKSRKKLATQKWREEFISRIYLRRTTYRKKIGTAREDNPLTETSRNNPNASRHIALERGEDPRIYVVR